MKTTLLLGKFIALLSVTLAITIETASAQCARASTRVAGRLYVSQAFGTGLDDSKGIKAAGAEALEVCRGALGAPNTEFVRYANVAPATFSSPGNNAFCYLVGAQRVCVNARDAGNPPHINSVDCYCVPSQCADGRDNDGDGAADLADFSCGGQPTNNNEATPLSQCQDGVDNDSDGATDLADFSCQNNRQRNDEANPRAQCQDGVDNDNDGAIDLNDFSCGQNKQHNDEANPKAQCQDGVDNDADGAIDLADFSCQNNRQKNDESQPKAECQDGLDNDADGAIDLADFSCGNDRQKNDESQPRSQCQDGVDNDADGAIDLADFSCGGNSQRNDEGQPRAQCQDGVDNDNNGVTDMDDSACSSPQDNSEMNGGARLQLSAECVTENTDGTQTAYFTYNNQNASAITTQFVSGFTSNATAVINVTSFKPGVCKGCAAATFTGASAGWTVTGDTIGTTSTTTNSRTPKCAAVQPLMSCQGYTDGKIRIVSGWTNPNQFAIYLPLGTLNNFAPGEQSAGQPVSFSSGTSPAGFNAVLPRGQKATTWTLNGAAISSSNVKVCDGECIDTATGSITGELNKIAKELADATRKAAKNLQAAAPEEAVDAERARRLATEYETDAAALTLGIPAVIKNCPEAPLFCETVNNGPTIDALIGLYAEARNTVKRVQSRAYFRKTGKTNRNDPLIRKAASLENDGLEQLAQLPRVAVQCK